MEPRENVQGIRFTKLFDTTRAYSYGMVHFCTDENGKTTITDNTSYWRQILYPFGLYRRVW
jgi:hypothetical protein